MRSPRRFYGGLVNVEILSRRKPVPPPDSSSSSTIDQSPPGWPHCLAPSPSTSALLLLHVWGLLWPEVLLPGPGRTVRGGEPETTMIPLSSVSFQSRGLKLSVLSVMIEGPTPAMIRVLLWLMRARVGVGRLDLRLQERLAVWKKLLGKRHGTRGGRQGRCIGIHPPNTAHELHDFLRVFGPRPFVRQHRDPLVAQGHGTCRVVKSVAEILVELGIEGKGKTGVARGRR